jgi:hypothetical protein
MKKRIAIFHYIWPLQIHTENIINSLLSHGFSVDLFLFDIKDVFINIDKLKNNNDFKIHNIRMKYIEKIAFRLYNKLLCDIFLKEQRIIHYSAIKYVKTILKANTFDYFLGVEKLGLIWAGMAMEPNFKIPLIYYSLELYDDNYADMTRNKSYFVTRKKEMYFVRKICGLIIQDGLREKEFKKYNRINELDHIKTFYLPVSIKGSKKYKKSNYWHKKFDLSEEKKILLIFGRIRKSRMSYETALECSKLGEEYITIFHGQGELEEVNRINCLGNNVFISDDFFPENEIKDIISSSTVGVVLYGNNNANDILTAFSSEKVARLMQSGIPIIAFNNISYKTLMNEFKCGELISTIREIPIAIHKIMHNYSKYRDNCYNAFDKYYNYNKYIYDMSNFILNP